ncbi:hypothetical protein [Arcticibacter sp.]|jgi:hypothetical protein|uniref:hypothetical protein n=1 Tax=Arcticibacter sp. TaxID=1872630 RepID=UPI00388E28A8
METSAKNNLSPILSYVYSDVEQLRSEIGFYNDEIRFFRTLLDRYLLPLIDKESIGKVQEIARQLSKFEEEKNLFSEETVAFLLKVKDKALESQPQLDRQDEKIYLHLLEKKNELMNSFKRFKKAFFAIMEHLLQTEKMQNLLEEA